MGSVHEAVMTDAERIDLLAYGYQRELERWVRRELEHWYESVGDGKLRKLPMRKGLV